MTRATINTVHGMYQSNLYVMQNNKAYVIVELVAGLLCTVQART